MKVAILGSNVEALLAAYTAKQLNCNVRIFTTNNTSPKPNPNRTNNFTAELLDSSIFDNLCDKPSKVHLFKAEPENIVKKSNLADLVFANLPCFSTNQESFDAWNLDYIESRLFTETFNDVILCGVIDQELLKDIKKSGSDIIISAIPLSEICGNPAHSFPLLTTTGTFRDWEFEIDPLNDFPYIYWNGKISGSSWFRVSYTFGRIFTEYPSTIRPPYIRSDELFPVEYPNNTTCRCNPDVLRIGSWGNWSSRFSDCSFLEIYNKVRKTIYKLNGDLN